MCALYASYFWLCPLSFKLKAKVDKIDVDKVRAVPVDLSKLRNVVNNEVAKKKTVYDKLVGKVNVDTSGFVLKTKFNTNKSDLEKKTSDADKKHSWYSVFSMWKSLRVLQKARTKIVARAIYTYLIFSYKCMFCFKIKNSCAGLHKLLARLRPWT